MKGYSLSSLSLILLFLLFFLSSCERFYTHQLRLQNNTSDTLLVAYIENSSEFRSTYPDSLRQFIFVPSEQDSYRAIYTITGENAATPPDTYTTRIDVLDELLIAKRFTRFDTAGRRFTETNPFITKDFLDRSYWEYFIDNEQDAGVYLFEIEEGDLN